MTFIVSMKLLTLLPQVLEGFTGKIGYQRSRFEGVYIPKQLQLVAALNK